MTNKFEEKALIGEILSSRLECGEVISIKHVEFIGMEEFPNKVNIGTFKEEPWGNLVKYGTSVFISRAMNSAYNIIIAHQVNGKVLQPNHGFPICIVIPG